jgi:hypothetical protein
MFGIPLSAYGAYKKARRWVRGKGRDIEIKRITPDPLAFIGLSKLLDYMTRKLNERPQPPKSED